MTDEQYEDELTEDELEEAHGEPLPDREEMSIVMPDPVHTLPVEPPATE
jgi:hypothetical protein